MTKKIRVGVLLGGASSEREISLRSGRMIAAHLPRERYDVVMLDTLALLAHNPHIPPALREQGRALLRAGGAPDASGDAVLPATAAIVPAEERRAIDVAFLALHGPYGEDGTMQGLLDLLGIPYVGSGTLASALAMDKVMARRMFAGAGVPVARGVVVERVDFKSDPEGVAHRTADAVLPAVVKPARQGSSVGMSLVNDRAGMAAALAQAFSYDARVLVEERLTGTELTVGVLGNRELQALPPVEIVPKRAFFDYQAKYDPALSNEICPARIPSEVARAAQELAIRAHRALDCRGVSRTDIMHTANGLFVLEVNTLPGMTEQSLLPKAARAAGISFPDLLERLIALALEPEA